MFKACYSKKHIFRPFNHAYEYKLFLFPYYNFLVESLERGLRKFIIGFNSLKLQNAIFIGKIKIHEIFSKVEFQKIYKQAAKVIDCYRLLVETLNLLTNILI